MSMPQVETDKDQNCENDEVKPMVERKFTILYGSQTGTAEEVAERIRRESKRFFFSCPIFTMDEFPVESLIFEPIVVFVCSTTGNGVEPDNMHKFWKFLLRKYLPSNSLTGLRFAVLGLGDSSYQKFNFTAKKLHRRLLQLGGHSLFDPGFADEQHELGSDAVIDPWIEKLWSCLLEEFPLPDGIEPLSKDRLYPSRWGVSLTATLQGVREDSSRSRMLEGESIKKRFSMKDPCFIELERNSRTTSADHFQDVRLLEFSAPKLLYEPGDVLMVRPCNFPAAVEQFFNVVSCGENQRISPNTVVRVTDTEKYSPVPRELLEPRTLKEFVESYWDLNMVPNRYFFELLSHFTTSDLERERLQELVSPEGQQDLFNYCNRPRRTTLEVLTDFRHAAANIPLPYMFEMFRPIQPRAFSIASSPKAHEGKVHLLVAVVHYKTRLVSPRVGLCSNWLRFLAVGQKIPAWVRKGTFTFPKDMDIPVIMIGPGTGVAPFRSYIHERLAVDEAGADRLYLFFGCRGKNADFHCKEEWLSLEKNQLLTLFCAFSRDQEEKIYVQDVLKQQALLVWRLINEEMASIFVAGRADRMPDDVREALKKDISSVQGQLPEDVAALFIQHLENTGRIQMETWS